MLPWLEEHKDAAKWGSINLGGPITTASGLVFIGATLDPYLRAFETATGKELWKGKLPASARSTPMTYQSPKGKQFVVISANGHNIVSDPHDEIVAFADADIWPEPDWLRRLIEPLTEDRAEIVTGFSWMLVKDGKLSSLVMTAMAASVATIPRLPMLNGVWGGSAAMRQKHFHALDMTKRWRGTLSEDLHLTNIAQEAGYRIAVPREILLRTGIFTNGFRDVIDGARRWYMLVRVHLPVAYAVTVIAMSFVSLGWVFALVGALSGDAFAVRIIVAALALSALKSFGRLLLVRKLWGAAGVAENMPFLRFDWLVSPLAVLVNALCGWSALFMRRTTWSGVTYEVRGPQDVVIVSRRAQP